jgi:hypothetical protein
MMITTMVMMMLMIHFMIMMMNAEVDDAYYADYEADVVYYEDKVIYCGDAFVDVGVD